MTRGGSGAAALGRRLRRWSSSRRPSCVVGLLGRGFARAAVFFAGAFFAAAFLAAAAFFAGAGSSPRAAFAAVDAGLQRGQQVDDVAAAAGRPPPRPARGSAPASLASTRSASAFWYSSLVLRPARSRRPCSRPATPPSAAPAGAARRRCRGRRSPAARISSGHSRVCSTITLSRTRSTASDSRCRSATLTTAIRSVSFSASRSSAYGLSARRVRLQVVGAAEHASGPPARTARTRRRRSRARWPAAAARSPRR